MRPEKEYSNYFDPPSDKQNANGEVYDSLPNNWRELFVFKSIYRDTAFSPWKKCLLFFASSNDNDNKNEINQIQNKSQWKSCAMKTVKIFLVLSDLYNEQTSSVLEQLELIGVEKGFVVI